MEKSMALFMTPKGIPSRSQRKGNTMVFKGPDTPYFRKLNALNQQLQRLHVFPGSGASETLVADPQDNEATVFFLGGGVLMVCWLRKAHAVLTALPESATRDDILHALQECVVPAGAAGEEDVEDED
jgi:hypothetical protein